MCSADIHHDVATFKVNGMVQNITRDAARFNSRGQTK